MDLELSLDYEKSFGLIRDGRVDNWFLMSSWRTTLCICFSYLCMVIGFSKWMKKRSQFELRGLMIGYNVTLVILSTYLFMSFIYYGLQTGFTVHCWTVDPRFNSVTKGLAATFWLYYISKIIEFMDTMFFIARKKFNLVTVLHVYHHMSIPALSWLAVRYGPGGLMTITFSLNCLVHVFMYTYYALAAAGSQFQRYIWWKKYMTVMQMTQFIVMILHALYMISIDCSYPRTLVWLTLINASTFLILFANYFIAARRETVRSIKTN